jgi:transposase
LLILMPRMRDANMRGLEIGEIARLAAVVMTLQGVCVETIAHMLGCSCVFVWRYVNRWSKQGMETATNHRGGRQSCFTEGIIQDIYYRT